MNKRNSISKNKKGKKDKSTRKTREVKLSISATKVLKKKMLKL